MRSSDRDSRANEGFILVAVLWILSILATLAIIYSLYTRESALELVNHDEHLQAEALAMSGVELAAYQLTAQRDRPLAGKFSFNQGKAAIAVEYNCENSRIDLNYAPQAMLAGLFTVLGAGVDDAATFAQRVIAWRTPLGNGVEDSEAQLYQAAGDSYGPRHGPFQDPYELGMVVGLPPLLVDRALPYVTVYSGRPEINVLSAAAPVLAAVPGLTADRLKLLLSLRAGSPQDVMNAQFGTSQSYITMESSAADRVGIDIAFTSGRRMHAEAVILVLDKDTQPYRILSWHADEPSFEGRVGARL